MTNHNNTSNSITQKMLIVMIILRNSFDYLIFHICQICVECSGIRRGRGVWSLNYGHTHFLQHATFQERICCNAHFLLGVSMKWLWLTRIVQLTYFPRRLSVHGVDCNIRKLTLLKLGDCELNWRSSQVFRVPRENDHITGQVTVEINSHLPVRMTWIINQAGVS